MPEGPEIKRVADKLAKTVLGERLETVWFAHPDAQQYAAALANSRVISVKTRGKALLTAFDCGLTVYSHNQLYGRWYFVARDRHPNTRRSLRWQLETENRAALLYSASEIRVLESDRLQEHPFLARAGIDVLSDDPTPQQLFKHFRQPRFARRSLAALMLDQHFVAGTGNYLRSEILFCAGLPPDCRLADLSDAQVRKLAKQTLLITQRSYETGGITNDPKIAAKLKKQGFKRAALRHFVFARAELPCHRCGTLVRRIEASGRRLYYCPVCQPSQAVDRA
ncbi:MAG: endonuclease VIII [Pseudomonadota bacterium]